MTFLFKYCFVILDDGLLELFGPKGIGVAVSRFRLIVLRLETGNIQDYAILIVCFVFLILFFMFFNPR